MEVEEDRGSRKEKERKETQRTDQQGGESTRPTINHMGKIQPRNPHGCIPALVHPSSTLSLLGCQ
jgi:hypothetical protein